MKRAVLFIPIVLALLIASIAFAQSGGGYDLTWNSIDGGGSPASGGSYALLGTIGQSDAGTLQGGSYTLSGGFLAGSGSPPVVNYRVYLSLILRE